MNGLAQRVISVLCAGILGLCLGSTSIHAQIASKEAGRKDTAMPVPATAEMHPRIWLTPSRVVSLRSNQVKRATEEWEQFRKWVPASPYNYIALHQRGYPAVAQGMLHYALMYRLTGDLEKGRIALRLMNAACHQGMDLIARSEGALGAPTVAEVAMCYDWCHDLISPQEREKIIAQLNQWGEWCMARQGHLQDPSDGRFYRALWAETAIGLATWGENPKAEEFLRHAWKNRLERLALPYLKRFARGGDWPGGRDYFDGPLYLAFAAAAWHSATQVNLFQRVPYFREAVNYQLHATLPGETLKAPKLYPAGERILTADAYMGGPAGVRRAHQSFMILCAHHFAGLREGGMARRWLGRKRTFDHPDTLLLGILFDRLASAPPSLESLPHSYHAAGTGFVCFRSGWDADALFVASGAGPRIARRQIARNNSLYLFRREVLTPLGERQKKCNSIEIGSRGQSSFPPKQAPSLLAYADKGSFAYYAGEASGAYASPFAEQGLCKTFTRQIVFIRPDIVVVCDRVATAQPERARRFHLNVAGTLQRSPQWGGKPVPKGKKGPFFIQSSKGSRLYIQSLLPEKTGGRVHGLGRRGVAYSAADRGGDGRTIFLTVLYAPPPGETPPLAVNAIKEKQVCGVAIRRSQAPWEIRFSTHGDVSATVRSPVEGGQTKETTLGNTIQETPRHVGSRSETANARMQEFEGRHKFGFVKHPDTKEPLWMQTSEVTNAQFRVFRREHRAEDAGDMPVANVSWEDARDFCLWLNEKFAGSSWSYGLPREVEWELAAKGGTSTTYWYGEPGKNVHESEWTVSKAKRARAVASGRANPWGLHDMLGNVREWCAPEAISPSLLVRPARGGSFMHRIELSKPTTSFSYESSYRSSYIGFRLVKRPRPN